MKLILMKVSKKMIFGPKNSIFGPQKGHFGHWGPQNDQPSGQMTIYRKTEVIQSYLRIGGRYNPIGSGPSEPKKWGFHRCSVKKCRFSGQKCAPAAGPRPALQQGQHKIVAFWTLTPTLTFKNINPYAIYNICQC